jgi:hypothetical protein
MPIPDVPMVLYLGLCVWWIVDPQSVIRAQMWVHRGEYGATARRLIGKWKPWQIRLSGAIMLLVPVVVWCWRRLGP